MSVLYSVSILSQVGLTGATATSTAVELEQISNVGLQMTWSAGSGGPAGTMSVECSNDGLNWGVFTLAAVPTITGNSGTVVANLNQLPFMWVRCKVTMTVGTVTVNVFAAGKSV